MTIMAGSFVALWQLYKELLADPDGQLLMNHTSLFQPCQQPKTAIVGGLDFYFSFLFECKSHQHDS